MATYRLTQDHFLPGSVYAPAGSIVSDSGLAGSLPIPIGWPPNLACDPLDGPAQAAMFAAGCSSMGLADRTAMPSPNNKWVGQPVAPSVLYWTPTIGKPGWFSLGTLGSKPTSA
jgi:hypothetical protein